MIPVLTFAVLALLIVGAICMLCLFTASLLASYFERIRLARSEGLTAQLSGKIQEMARWCCWYFPITEDIEDYLLHGREGIDKFRERMWEKHGKREVKAS